MAASAKPGKYDPVQPIRNPVASGAKMPARLPTKFSIPVHNPMSSGGEHDCRITSRFPVASPTSDPPMISATAAPGLRTMAAGISKRPVANATVTTAFRVRVSSHPLLTNRSAIHPPIGSLTPNTKNGAGSARSLSRVAASVSASAVTDQSLGMNRVVLSPTRVISERFYDNEFREWESFRQFHLGGPVIQ